MRVDEETDGEKTGIVCTVMASRPDLKELTEPQRKELAEVLQRFARDMDSVQWEPNPHNLVVDMSDAEVEASTGEDLGELWKIRVSNVTHAWASETLKSGDIEPIIMEIYRQARERYDANVRQQ